MGIDINKTIREANSGDEGQLQHLEGFLNSQDQDEDTEIARNAIKARRAAITANSATARMTTQALDYRNKLPGMKEQAYAGVQDQARRGLSEQLAGVKQGANSRGLLYSGLKQGADQAAVGNTASALATARGDINDSFEAQARGREDAARSGNADAMATQLSQDSDVYGKAMENVKRRQQTMSAVGGALGSVAGGAIAGMRK